MRRQARSVGAALEAGSRMETSGVTEVATVLAQGEAVNGFATRADIREPRILPGGTADSWAPVRLPARKSARP